MGQNSHPAWDVYDLWRTSKLNCKYYSRILQNYINIDKALDLIIAFTAPTGGVAAWLFWGTPIGSIVWKILLTIASLCALLKPTFQFSERARKLEPILSGYRLLEHDIGIIIQKMKRVNEFNNEIIECFDSANNRKGVLISQCSEVKENKRLREKFTNEVIQELSTYEYCLPEVKNAERNATTNTTTTTGAKSAP